MKALIVAESEMVLSECSQFLTEKGCDVIKYRWLIKALDNLEEIDPQVIIISVMDYPRHWKTFVQFINSTFSSNLPHVFLFASEAMGENEIRKASWLGVKGIVKGFTTDEDKDILSAVIPSPKHPLRLTIPQYKLPESHYLDTTAINSTTEKSHEEVVDTSDNKIGKEVFSTQSIHYEQDSIPIKKQDPAVIKDDSLKLLFSNPHNKIMITGKVLLVKGNIVLYVCDNEKSLKELKEGDLISHCMIKKNGQIQKRTIKILAIDSLELKMEIQEWL